MPKTFTFKYLGKFDLLLNGPIQNFTSYLLVLLIIVQSQDILTKCSLAIWLLHPWSEMTSLEAPRIMFPNLERESPHRFSL